MTPPKNDRPQTPAGRQGARARSAGIRFIRLWFTDILGQLKSFSIHSEQLDDAFEGGMGFDGSSITGFNAIEESDMIALPDPTHVRGAPVAPGGRGRRRRAHVRRHPDARARALRGRSAPRAAPRRRARRVDGLRPLLRRPRAGVLPVPRQQGHRGARRGRLLRPHDARRRLRRPPRHRARAGEVRHPGGVLPPRGRPEPARDRHALRRRAEDGRRLHDLPDHGQGDRAQVRLARDVHAQAAVRRERLRHAHPPVAVQGRVQRLLRRGRPLLPVATSARRSSPASCATRAS